MGDIPRSWQSPRQLAPDTWCYQTDKGIEVYGNPAGLPSQMLAVIPKRYVVAYVRSLSKQKKQSDQREGEAR